MPKPRQAYSYVDDWKSLWEPDLEAIAFNGASCDPTRVDPKVLQWAKQNCSHKPHFIKIVNRNAANGRPGLQSRLNNCQLTVPSPFVRKHFRELERVVTLENEEGKTWRVSFGAARTDPSWLQGWKRVAADNDLKPGEVIVFVLVGNSRFQITRFDEDGNIISEKSTSTRASTLNDTAAVKKKFTSHSDSHGHEEPGSVTNPEDSHLKSPRNSKQAAALASKNDQSTAEFAGSDQPSGLGFHGHGHGVPQLVVPTDKQIVERPCKRRRLRKVGEIKFKFNSDNGNLAIRKAYLHDSAEAGSTSMAESPSTVTLVTSHAPRNARSLTEAQTHSDNS